MVSGVRGIPLKATAAIDEVKTTLLTEEVFKHELRTLIVPFTAGSSNSAYINQTHKPINNGKFDHKRMRQNERGGPEGP